MPNPIVAVRGEAVIDAEPETARIKVTVTARDKDRSLTLTRLAARMDAVREVLDAHPDAIERRETGHLVVYPESRSWLGGGERVGAYTGSGSTAVVITDFTLLGEILVRLGNLDQAHIDGPWWEIRPDSPVYRQARQAAVLAAVTRATQYAEALGAHLTGLIDVADVGLTITAAPHPPSHDPHTAPRKSRGWRLALGGSAANQQPPPLRLDPGTQHVHAEAEARFTMSPPPGLFSPEAGAGAVTESACDNASG